MDSASLAAPLSPARNRNCGILVTALGAVLIGGTSMAICATPAAGQAVNLAVDDPRPVAQAVQSLVQKYGYQITYEDPAYLYQGDLADRNVNGFKDRIPAGGSLSVSFTPASGMSTVADMAGLIEKLLQVHAVSDRGGHFRLVQQGQVLHVIPSEVKDRNGNWGPQGSILDAVISLPSKERTGMETLEDICAAVGIAAHARLVVMTIPNNVILPYRSRLSAENESARSVLLRALNGTQRRLTWFLMYDPSDGLYALNILVVPDQFSAQSRSPQSTNIPALGKTSAQGAVSGGTAAPLSAPMESSMPKR